MHEKEKGRRLQVFEERNQCILCLLHIRRERQKSVMLAVRSRIQVQVRGPLQVRRCGPRVGSTFHHTTITKLQNPLYSLDLCYSLDESRDLYSELQELIFRGMSLCALTVSVFIRIIGAHLRGKAKLSTAFNLWKYRYAPCTGHP
jgi:hypothetical protein